MHVHMRPAFKVLRNGCFFKPLVTTTKQNQVYSLTLAIKISMVAVYYLFTYITMHRLFILLLTLIWVYLVTVHTLPTCINCWLPVFLNGLKSSAISRQGLPVLPVKSRRGQCLNINKNTHKGSWDAQVWGILTFGPVSVFASILRQFA